MSSFNPLQKSVVVGAIDGYLQSLRRVTKGSSDYGAYLIDTKLSLEAAIDHFLSDRLDEYVIEESESISMQKADQVLQERIFSRVILSDLDIREAMKFDFLDYFNLICLDETEETDNPLYRNGAEYINVQDDFYMDLKIMVIKLNAEVSILIFLGDRK